MRNCDHYKTPEELGKAFRKICTEIEAQDKCNEKDCIFFGENYSDCVMNFAYAEYDDHLIDKLILEPCPCCNGTALLRDIQHEDGKPTYYVVCTSCGVSTLPDESKEKVIEIWNRRTEK